MRLRVMLLTLLWLCLSLPMGSAHQARTQEAEGPLFVTAAQWDEGTFLSWAPADSPEVEYLLYRGDSPDTLTRVAKLKTIAYYDAMGDAGGALYYGVSILRDGVESKMTVIEAESRASCVKVGMNGSVAITPYRCLPSLRA